MQRPEVHSLTGVRGIAALFVVFYHLHAYELVSGPAYNVLHHGYLSVDLFFFLSGFVMSLSYARMFEVGQKGKFWTFMARRVARIYPLYLVLTLIEYGNHLRKGGVGDHMPSIGKLIGSLLLVQCWGFGGTIIPQAWSISTEWGVYLLFPLLVALCLRGARSRAVTVGIALYLLLVALTLVPTSVSHIDHFRGPMDMANGADLGPLLRCILEFSMGMLAWRLAQVKQVQNLCRNSWPATILFLAILALMMIPNADVAIVLLFPFFVVAISSDQPVFSKVLGSAIPRWLGEVSYSVYLLHEIVPGPRKAFDRALAALHLGHEEALWIFFFIGEVLILATLTYYLIEKPGSRLLRNLLGSGKAKSAKAPPTIAEPAL